MDQFFRSSLFLFVLLNPFLLSVLLLELLRELPPEQFFRVVIRASLISGAVFSVFAIGGERIFVDVLQVQFESFLVFGGLIFLIVGVRMALRGPDTLRELRGPPQFLAGSVAMPFMIGPATVSASVLAGSRLSIPLAVLSILAALVATTAGLMLLKYAHDAVQKRQQRLVDRYVELVGRVSALFVGSVAVEMLAQGVRAWLDR